MMVSAPTPPPVKDPLSIWLVSELVMATLTPTPVYICRSSTWFNAGAHVKYGSKSLHTA